MIFEIIAALAHHQSRNHRDPAACAEVCPVIFLNFGTFQFLYDSLSGTMVVILISGHKSIRGEFTFIFFITLSIVFFPIGVFLNHTGLKPA